MATHTTLSNLFSDIANAIRAKTGGSANIVADDFPDEIAAIPTGSSLPSGMAAGTFTVTSAISSLVAVAAHGLGSTPQFAFVVRLASSSGSRQFAINSPYVANLLSYADSYVFGTFGSWGRLDINEGNYASAYLVLDSTNLSLNGTGTPWETGTYYWLAIA